MLLCHNIDIIVFLLYFALSIRFCVSFAYIPMSIQINETKVYRTLTLNRNESVVGLILIGYFDIFNGSPTFLDTGKTNTVPIKTNNITKIICRCHVWYRFQMVISYLVSAGRCYLRYIVLSLQRSMTILWSSTIECYHAFKIATAQTNTRERLKKTHTQSHHMPHKMPNASSK